MSGKNGGRRIARLVKRVYECPKCRAVTTRIEGGEAYNAHTHPLCWSDHGDPGMGDPRVMELVRTDEHDDAD
jgi:hypothetical protein